MDVDCVDVSSVHKWLNNQNIPSHLSANNQIPLLPRANNPQISKTTENSNVPLTA